ncbi:ABC transporter ATP-binding protein [Chelatococcus asaccharovorans]|uniref:ABC transporter ATP-binding protein n=1 Tax=Chelatococcus asaccharovorans TaxID=28210 RepID=UPI00224C6F06|nr:ABC transporter ATP-binding protein [Chelatococcus asaccharovorans]CAH1655637.1 dipeptide ABC transporter ATP binding subunit DppD [Chelatococcus asaccharovorans]CAH1685359.1 dipeptide ABC transporter ATP binding subunit DppD [Chelatococcus asaccharovorans]
MTATSARNSGQPDVLVEVEGLQTYFLTRGEPMRAVDGVSFKLHSGEVLGIVGESGSGKTITGHSILGLVEPPGRVVGGSIRFRGRDLLALSDEELRQLRGDAMAAVFQDPMMTLNPVLRIDTQIMEAIWSHHRVSKAEARRRAVDVLRLVGIPSPEKRASAYPHELSGGMRQRVVIAIALVNSPALIIADEPTTALDVTIQSQIIYEMRKLCREKGTAMIWITHDLSVVASLADRICVMYAGEIVEEGDTEKVLGQPAHHYTRGLIASIPSGSQPGEQLPQIKGMITRYPAADQGCRFRDRCPAKTDLCDTRPPDVRVSDSHSAKCHHPAHASAALAQESVS